MGGRRAFRPSVGETAPHAPAALVTHPAISDEGEGQVSRRHLAFVVNREQAARLRRRPLRPVWKTMYASPSVRIESWSKFLSEAYWNVTLEE